MIVLVSLLIFVWRQTGTLTQNVMNFLKCSINGQIYGKEATGTKFASFLPIAAALS